MVIIEMFDYESPMDNVLSAIVFQPEEVVFWGTQEKPAQIFLERLKRVLTAHDIHTKLSFCLCDTSDTYRIAGQLTDLIKKYPDCALDLSGGEDEALITAGMVMERMKQMLPMYRMDPQTLKVRPFRGAAPSAAPNVCKLSIKDIITLFGGSVIVRNEQNPGGTILWDMTAPMVRDLKALWQICKKSPYFWNKKVLVYLSPMHGRSISGQSHMQFSVTIGREEYCASLRKNRTSLDECINDPLMLELERQGLVSVGFDEYQVTAVFKNAFVYECITKAGTAWEMKLFYEANSLRDEKGQPYFDDVMTGVVLDWDGVVCPGEMHRDVQNEVDVVVARNNRLAFISAKNGRYDNEEIYKLGAVKNRLGGKYANAVLFASQDTAQYNTDAVKMRADEMGISIFEGRNDAEIRENLRSLLV